MKLISSGARLTRTLSRLLHNHSEVSFAVAWASSGHEIFELLRADPSIISRAIIGTHFYQTHPDVLDTFRSDKNVRFMLQHRGVFHPKLYLFQSDEHWAALIGSANLTAGALKDNSEAMVLIESQDQESSKLKYEVIRLIDQYWKKATAISKRDAEAYRQIWGQKQHSIRRLSDQYGSKKARKLAIESSVMSMSWDRYLKRLKTEEGQNNIRDRVELLEKLQKDFEEYPSFSQMPTNIRKAIAGLPSDYDDRWAWFGSMKGVGYFHQAVNVNNRHLSQALDEIPLHGQVNRADYVRYINKFVKAFPNGRHGVSVASRLLAMKRPDQFLCLDSKNLRRLCEDFGIQKTGMTYDRYWDDIIERILDAPWWNADRPKNMKHAAIWNGRAAMLDVLFYEYP